MLKLYNTGISSLTFTAENAALEVLKITGWSFKTLEGYEFLSQIKTMDLSQTGIYRESRPHVSISDPWGDEWSEGDSEPEEPV